MSKKLKQALTKQKQDTEQVVPQLTGILGLPLDGQRRVEVSGRNAYVYVRLRNNESEVIQAFNNQVAPAYNLPVLVERQGNRYIVIGVDTQRYENNWNSFAPFLPKHGNTHSFDLESGGGGDIVWVYPRQFTPLLTMPSGSKGGPNVLINPYILKNNDGTWKYIGNTGTTNITTYNPTSATGAIIVLVYVDSVSGNPGLLVGSGTVFNNNITGVSRIAPYIPTITNPSWIPDSAIRLITGTSVIGWDNIYDVRQFLHPTPTGTGGGSGVPGGTNNQLQFNNAGAFGGAGIVYTGTSTDEILRTAGVSDAGRNFYLIGEDAIGVGDASGGSFLLNAGNTVGSGTGGGLNLRGGNSQYGQGGYIGIIAGNSNGQDAAGIIEIIAGSTLSTNPLAQGFVSINDPYTDNQHRFITSGTSTTRSYAFPDESGVFLLDAPVDGTTYGRKDKAWVAVSGSGGGAITAQDEGVPLGTVSTFNFVGNNVQVTVSGSVARVSVTGSSSSSSTIGPQGFGDNYRISAASSSGTLTVALKTMAGSDPSPTDKVVFRIANSLREVTSALSFSLPSGTNWFNIGSSEFAGQVVDFFVYVVWDDVAGAVDLGIARVPYATSLIDLSSTSTNEKYIAGVTYDTGFRCEVIGRFPAALSATPGFSWSGPSSAFFVINRPIYKTNRLEYVPTWVGFTTQPGVTFSYIVDGSTVFVYAMASGDLTSNSTSTSATLPFTCATITGFLPRNSTSAKNNGTLATTPGMATITSGDDEIIYYRDFAASAWTASGVKQVYATEIYYPLN